MTERCVGLCPPFFAAGRSVHRGVCAPSCPPIRSKQDQHASDRAPAPLRDIERRKGGFPAIRGLSDRAGQGRDSLVSRDRRPATRGPASGRTPSVTLERRHLRPGRGRQHQEDRLITTQGRPAEPARSRGCPVYRSHPRPMVRYPRDLAGAGAATLVDRDRRTTRGDGGLAPGRLPPRRAAPHRRAGAGPALREAAQLTTIAR
jgi:hypothetical protein